MINLWDYVGAENVRITTVSDKTYEGNVISVDDVEEMYDATEDEISLETTDGEFVGLKSSEVSKIERL
ncbi:MAG: hypothetical protein RSD39_05125 [Oscillospiraceae bacterium]